MDEAVRNILIGNWLLPRAPECLCPLSGMGGPAGNSFGGGMCLEQSKFLNTNCSDAHFPRGWSHWRGEKGAPFRLQMAPSNFLLSAFVYVA